MKQQLLTLSGFGIILMLGASRATAQSGDASIDLRTVRERRGRGVDDLQFNGLHSQSAALRRSDLTDVLPSGLTT